MTPALALGIALVASGLAWLARGVTASGALAAGIVGFLVLWATGWPGGAVLAVFFVSSSLVSRAGARRAGASDARGEQRDHVQVLANGGAAALGACAERWFPGLGLWLVTGALSAAAADTWATGLGAFSPRQPRDLLRGVPVARGTSGGVSLTGTLGGLVGAVLVSGVAAVASGDAALLLVCSSIGVGGMALDSLLGAARQARFECPACLVPSERRVHRCGTRTRLVGGWSWLDNDGVNALMTTVAGAAAGISFIMLHP